MILKPLDVLFEQLRHLHNTHEAVGGFVPFLMTFGRKLFLRLPCRLRICSLQNRGLATVTILHCVMRWWR